VIVIPAIDLMNGRAVRLLQGRREDATVYADAPLDLVDRYADAGAQRIHVVDLDGAFAGEPVQLELVARLAARARERRLAIEVGGGVRDEPAVDALLDAGADQVVVGTLAVRHPDVVEALCARHRSRIVVATDARDGRVAVDGWQTNSELGVLDLARAAQAWGATAILYTDVGRDGMRTGPAIAATVALQAELDIPVWASGGVGTLADLDACSAAGIRGVIVGRALYEGAFTVEEAVARC
jgi:phosphoribosylformimino-5-aminoimidazole carboxamide ribotide isomerase